MFMPYYGGSIMVHKTVWLTQNFKDKRTSFTKVKVPQLISHGHNGPKTPVTKLLNY